VLPILAFAYKVGKGHNCRTLSSQGDDCNFTRIGLYYIKKMEAEQPVFTTLNTYVHANQLCLIITLTDSVSVRLLQSIKTKELERIALF
jgi:hypothetical protein